MKNAADAWQLQLLLLLGMWVGEVKIETSWQRSANETSNRASRIPDRLRCYIIYAPNLYLCNLVLKFEFTFFSHVRVIGSCQVMK